MYKDFEDLSRRVRDSGVPFAANDNISSALLPGDVDIIQAEVERRLQSVLEALLIDTSDDHNTNETAKRMAKMFVREVCAGRYEPMPKATDFPNAKSLDDVLVVGPIDVRSMCSHHFAPILGKAWIAVLPSDRVIGISKFARIANWIFSRPQIQEEAAVQLADTLESLIKPNGLAVVIRASHTCMTWRGVKQTSSEMVTSVMRGVFRDSDSARAEVLELMK